MMKIQEKNTLLTPLLEDLYFKHLAFYSWKNQDFPKILKNLLTHYCIYDLDRVNMITNLSFKIKSLILTRVVCSWKCFWNK